MKIAVDISPLASGHFLQHRVRGTGFYVKNLKESLLEYFPENEYFFFKRGDDIPKDVDLIHIPYFEPYFITLPVKKSIKTIVTVHDLTPLVFKDKFPAGVKGRIKWGIQKKSLKQADVIITDSHSSKDDIHKFTGISINKIEVVYLAAANHFKKIQSVDKKITKKYKIPNEFILYVGDATWNKNLPNLIRAVNSTSYSLVIAGSAFANKDYDKNNPWNADLHEAQVLASSNKNIYPIGYVSDSDLAQLYNLAKASIMPSFYEGFGLPVLEAMQSGCPVITSRAGSIEEVVDSAAYFVEPDDIGSITKGIEEVMSSENLRKALSEKGLSQSNKFTWEKAARETNNIYEKIVKN